MIQATYFDDQFIVYIQIYMYDSKFICECNLLRNKYHVRIATHLYNNTPHVVDGLNVVVY
jgi:hypothetical protein